MSRDPIPAARHNLEVRANLARWNAKPLLQRIYTDFHGLIAEKTLGPEKGLTVELGSGIGVIKNVIPHCIRTDTFPNPWIDRVEDAYRLSFPDRTVANLILSDVWHHLRYPGTVLEEFHRVLVPRGRVIIFDPCMSALGVLVYGAFHHEPIALTRPIEWNAPPGWSSDRADYYAAQSNGFRTFWGKMSDRLGSRWNVVSRERFSALCYVLSGGYSKPQLYPSSFYPLIRRVERLCDRLPLMFATRLLVTLEKR